MIKPDENAQKALERAAHAAVFGSREARSGRFDLVFTAEKRSAAMILRAAQTAYQSWANWEAINDQLADAQLGEAVLDLELAAVGTVRHALSRDAILRGYSLSDVFEARATDDRLTICRFAPVLADATTADLLGSERWALDLGHSEVTLTAAAVANANRVARIKSLIVANWGKARPVDLELQNLREALRPLRNRLAHALEPSSFEAPTINQIRALMTLTLDLATELAFLFAGSAVDAKSFEEFSKSEAEKFWTIAFKAPRLEHQMRVNQLRGASVPNLKYP